MKPEKCREHDLWDCPECKNLPEESAAASNDGLAAIHRDMVGAIKEQTAAVLAGEIAAQKRHDEEMAKKQGLKEQNVWLQGCTAALCNDGVNVKVAADCADGVLEHFKRRFGN